MAKLTKRLIDNIQPDQKQDVVIWDDELKGFGARVKPSGRKTFIIQYRNAQGRSRRMTVGLFGRLTTEEARRQARQFLAEAEKGLDPAEIKVEVREAPTVAKVAKRYMEQHANVKKKPVSIEADERLFRLVILPALGRRKIADVTRTDVIRLHHDQKDKPIRANRALALMSKLFNLSEKWGLRPDNTNPCRHVERYKEKKRERFLAIDELSRLGSVLDQIENDKSEVPSVVTAIRLLILTGARLSEILTLQWDHVDLEAGALRLPDSKTGAKIIPLGQPAISVLKSTPKIVGNPFVCPGRKPQGHLVGLQKTWVRIRKRAELEELRLHDLRHSFASVGAAAGLGLPIIGKLLGHTKSTTTERYAHLDTSPLQVAADQISQQIESAMKAPVKQKVVPFENKRTK